ncbi:hypothetical protein OIK40_04185 [Erythrobacter sp. sf7]|uniref:Phasin domain-containing protein n=1 Tax=Erythrobacter fulvus TaxID=2987523 RepID=A0ABT5JNZ0_9SPHN|nr:hypothetical protein [Erythrobacter fulvus]MDC8753838.1 hypothetical protein [Erythrobacter fulvus]
MANLADRTGMPIAEVQVAGRKLFEQLSSKDSDLAKALIQASSASGLDPRQVASILTVVTEDFQQPLDIGFAGNMLETLQGAADGAMDRIKATSERAREVVSSVDVDAIRAKGEGIVDRVKDEVAAVDLGQIKDRVSQAGESLIEKARNAVSKLSASAKHKSPKSDNG